jgi:hypothetical protein
MRRLLVLLLAACSEHVPQQAVAIAPLPVPSQTIEPVVEVRKPAQPDDADFSSDRGGMIHLTAARDGSLSGTYPNGILTCSASFACRWYESSATGRATFQRKPDGTLAGTWGSEESDDNGGSWTLVPVKHRGALDGVWDTNFGAAKIESTSSGIHIDYEGGTVDCPAQGVKLACTWNEGGGTGGAELAVESERVIRGKWGSGTSSTDGGAWVFVRR